MSVYETHVEIEPRVHLVRGLNSARFPEANSLFIDDEILTLVDAGSDIGQITITMKDLGYGLDDLDRIVLTHFHIDHKGHAEQLRRISDCEVMCHPLSVKGISTFQGWADECGMTDHPVFNEWKPTLQSWLPLLSSEYEITGHYENMKPITCGEVELVPLHLPGHTKDHTCFGINGLETIYLVDIDLTRFGPFYGNMVSDIQEFKDSIKSVIDLSPKIGISSHLLDPVKHDLRELLEEFLSVFDKREAHILKRISDGQDTIEKLAALPTIYPRIRFNYLYFFEECMLEKHVELLVEEGTIHTEGEHLEIARG
ncbi:MAG: MBL fold metallo-hydrolase [Candidatus Thorarchaeota archaeon]|jgi:glyoxylase-like metal-dependent hydrolase (beta-lactamase superfamily II)